MNCENISITKDKYTHIIWDFNGTLLDDLSAAVGANNVMLKKRGLRQIEDMETFFEMADRPMWDFYREMGFDLEKEDYREIAAEWGELYREFSSSCTLFPGALECLCRIRDMGIPQIVLSASEKNILSDQLVSLGIAEFFSEVLGLETFHTIDKTGITQAWKNRNPTAVPIVIGDTENDVKTAEILSCDCILKSGGHRSAASLSKHGYPVIDSFDKII